MVQSSKNFVTGPVPKEKKTKAKRGKKKKKKIAKYFDFCAFIAKFKGHMYKRCSTYITQIHYSGGHAGDGFAALGVQLCQGERTKARVA